MTELSSLIGARFPRNTFSWSERGQRGAPTDESHPHSHRVSGWGIGWNGHARRGSGPPRLWGCGPTQRAGCRAEAVALGLLVAQGHAQCLPIIPRQAQAAGQGAAAEQPHPAKDVPREDGRTAVSGPELR